MAGSATTWEASFILAPTHTTLHGAKIDQKAALEVDSDD